MRGYDWPLLKQHLIVQYRGNRHHEKNVRHFWVKQKYNRFTDYREVIRCYNKHAALLRRSLGECRFRPAFRLHMNQFRKQYSLIWSCWVGRANNDGWVMIISVPAGPRNALLLLLELRSENGAKSGYGAWAFAASLNSRPRSSHDKP